MSKFAVIVSKKGYKVLSDYQEGDKLPDGYELVRVFDKEDYAEEYKNECEADRWMQIQEQRAADSCHEEI